MGNGTPNGEPSQNGPNGPRGPRDPRDPRDPRGPSPKKKDPMKDLMTRREADAAPRETRETKMAKARSQKVRSQKVRSQQKPRLPGRNRKVATKVATKTAKTETAKE